MSCKTSVWTEGQQNVRPKLADPKTEFVDEAIELLAIKLAVGVVEHDAFGDLQDFARGFEFFAANVSEFAIGLGVSTVPRRLARRQTDDARLDSAIMIQTKCAAEIASFIIRVRRDGHQAKHPEIVHERAANVQSV